MSNHNASVLLAQAAETIRDLQGELDYTKQANVVLASKVASYERYEMSREIATLMEENNLNTQMTFEDKVASIYKAKSLENVREAVKMASSGTIQIAQLSDTPGNGGGLDSLTAFCLDLSSY